MGSLRVVGEEGALGLGVTVEIDGLLVWRQIAATQMVKRSGRRP